VLLLLAFTLPCRRSFKQWCSSLSCHSAITSLLLQRTSTACNVPTVLLASLSAVLQAQLQAVVQQLELSLCDRKDAAAAHFNNLQSFNGAASVSTFCCPAGAASSSGAVA
jgi:hypothetical protein